MTPPDATDAGRAEALELLRREFPEPWRCDVARDGEGWCAAANHGDQSLMVLTGTQLYGEGDTPKAAASALIAARDAAFPQVAQVAELLEAREHASDVALDTAMRLAAVEGVVRAACRQWTYWHVPDIDKDGPRNQWLKCTELTEAEIDTLPEDVRKRYDGSST